MDRPTLSKMTVAQLKALVRKHNLHTNYMKGYSKLRKSDLIDSFLKHSKAKPAEAKPAEAKPEEAKPKRRRLKIVKAAEAKPAEAKPAAAKPAAAKPKRRRLNIAKPEAAKPEAAKPKAGAGYQKPPPHRKDSEVLMRKPRSYTGTVYQGMSADEAWSRHGLAIGTLKAVGRNIKQIKPWPKASAAIFDSESKKSAKSRHEQQERTRLLGERELLKQGISIHQPLSRLSRKFVPDPRWADPSQHDYLIKLYA